MKKYKLIGASQTGISRNGDVVKIENGDIITVVPPVFFRDKILSWISGSKWYYFSDLRDNHLFRVHQSIIDRYFEEVR